MIHRMLNLRDFDPYGGYWNTSATNTSTTLLLVLTRFPSHKTKLLFYHLGFHVL